MSSEPVLTTNNTTMFCSICQDEYELSRVVVVQIPCRHQFCLKCFCTLESSSCPLCRKPYEVPIQVPDPVLNRWEKEIYKKVQQQVEEYLESMEMINGLIAPPESPSFGGIQFVSIPRVGGGGGGNGRGRGRGRRRRQGGRNSRVADPDYNRHLHDIYQRPSRTQQFFVIDDSDRELL
jgi:hypothetical protein